MKYPCGLIKDLMPLYLDGVCCKESENAVKQHLDSCESCRKYCENMRDDSALSQGQTNTTEERQMLHSLKNVKKKIGRKNKAIIGACAAAAFVLAAAYQVLFNVPLKDIGLSDVYVTASVYPLSVLANEANRLTLENNEQNEVTISYGEDDGSKQMSITIPDMPASRITMTSDVMEKCEYATAVTWSSKYFLKEIRYDDKDDENGGTIYVSAFKTTLLGNKAKDYNSKMLNLEMRKIDKIVFVEKSGKETVLWKNTVE